MQQPKWIRQVAFACGGAAIAVFLVLAVVGFGDDPDFPREAQVLIGILVGVPGAVVVSLALHYSRHPPELLLDVHGFGIVRAHDVLNFRWDSVEDFRIGFKRRQRRAVFDHVQRRRSGHEHRETVAFPDTYGMAPRTLCSMMETWRTAALRPHRS